MTVQNVTLDILYHNIWYMCVCVRAVCSKSKSISFCLIHMLHLARDKEGGKSEGRIERR